MAFIGLPEGTILDSVAAKIARAWKFSGARSVQRINQYLAGVNGNRSQSVLLPQLFHLIIRSDGFLAFWGDFRDDHATRASPFRISALDEYLMTGANFARPLFAGESSNSQASDRIPYPILFRNSLLLHAGLADSRSRVIEAMDDGLGAEFESMGAAMV